MQPLFISASLKARSRIKPEVKWKSQETSAKHAWKLKVKWRSRDCTLGRALLRATVHTVHCDCAHFTCQHDHCALYHSDDRGGVVGKTNALHLVDCTSMDVDCSKEEEAVKKDKACFKHLQLLLIFFCAQLSSLAALLTGNKKRCQAPTTDNNNIVCYDKKSWRKRGISSEE